MLVAVLSLSWATTVLAQSPGASLLVPSAPTAKAATAKTPPTVKPMPRAGMSNPCTAYGPSFAKLPGTDTCVKVGGAASIEAGSSLRR
ncbi:MULTISPECIES: porin [unclassified Bradyrhizobium]|nr:MULTISPECIES: porin [unclassified Bradyrhizobium]